MRNAVIIALLCASSSAALAQNAASTSNGPSSPPATGAAASAPNVLSEVVVTGTLIRGEAAPIGSTLTTLSPADIAESGTTNFANLMATVPMLNSFNIAPQGGEFLSGGSSVPGIHDLPGTATLVLIDGHRAVGDSPLLSVPDPSDIPSIAIRSIQVLPTGGSAIYGSDAVAGVINILLRTNFNGEETSVTYGKASPYNSDSIEQLFGRTWNSGSFMLAASYDANSDLLDEDRSFYTPEPAGLQFTPTYTCGNPNVEIGTQTYGGPGLEPGPLRACNPGATADIYFPQRKYAVLTTVRQHIGSRLLLSFDGKYTDSLMKDQTGTEAIDNGTNKTGQPIITLPDTNPYFYQPPGGTATSEQVMMSTAAAGFPSPHTTYRSKSGMVDLGALYNLGHSWTIDGDLDYSWSSSSTQNPNGGFNTTYLDDAINSTNPSTALNPFGTTNSTVAAEILDSPLFFLASQAQYVGNVKANGNLFELPAGVVKLAVGAQDGYYGYSGSNPIGDPGFPGFSDNFVDVNRRFYGVFAEVDAPIVSSANALPGVKKLDVSIAERHDRYSDIGGTTNPKFGINWTPFGDFILQATYGTSFHAPQLADEYGIDTRATGGTLGTAPPGYTLPPGTPFLTAGIAGGRALEPELAKTSTFGFNWTPTYVPGFQADVSYFMIHFSNQVEIPSGSSLFTNPFLESRFVTLNPTGNPADPFAPLTPAQIASVLGGIRLIGFLDTIPLTSLYEIIDERRANIGATEDNGFDFDFTYHRPVPGGVLLSGLSGEYITKYETNEGAGSPWVNNLTNGQSYFTSDTSAYNVIPWRVRATLGWQIGPDFLTQAAVNYTGHYNYGYTNSAGKSAIEWVGEFTTVDWLAQYYFPHDLKVQLNVYNVLNQAPPLVEIAGGFVPESADPLGRLIQLTLVKKW
jgi:iron complex outermembrane recepter protein